VLLLLEDAAPALSNCQATRTEWGVEVAFAPENKGDRHSNPFQRLGAGVRDP
jgi:hypothetical protein